MHLRGSHRYAVLVCRAEQDRQGRGSIRDPHGQAVAAGLQILCPGQLLRQLAEPGLVARSNGQDQLIAGQLLLQGVGGVTTTTRSAIESASSR